MKKIIVALIICLALLVFPLAYLFIGFTFTLDANPFAAKAKNNQEAMEYVDILREEFTLIKPHLEILRNGKVGQEGYSLFPDIHGELFIYEDDDSYLLSENTVNLPMKEIDAIEYLFLSDKLNENADYLNYGSASWVYAMGTQGGMFAESSKPDFYIGIFYFEDNKIPEELQNNKEYLEELEDNYWIVACNMQKP